MICQKNASKNEWRENEIFALIELERTFQMGRGVPGKRILIGEQTWWCGISDCFNRSCGFPPTTWASPSGPPELDPSCPRPEGRRWKIQVVPAFPPFFSLRTVFTCQSAKAPSDGKHMRRMYTEPLAVGCSQLTNSLDNKGLG